MKRSYEFRVGFGCKIENNGPFTRMESSKYVTVLAHDIESAIKKAKHIMAQSDDEPVSVIDESGSLLNFVGDQTAITYIKLNDDEVYY